MPLDEGFFVLDWTKKAAEYVLRLLTPQNWAEVITARAHGITVRDVERNLERKVDEMRPLSEDLAGADAREVGEDLARMLLDPKALPYAEPGTEQEEDQKMSLAVFLSSMEIDSLAGVMKEALPPGQKEVLTDKEVRQVGYWMLRKVLIELKGADFIKDMPAKSYLPGTLERDIRKLMAVFTARRVMRPPDVDIKRIPSFTQTLAMANVGSGEDLKDAVPISSDIALGLWVSVRGRHVEFIVIEESVRVRRGQNFLTFEMIGQTVDKRPVRTLYYIYNQAAFTEADPAREEEIVRTMAGTYRTLRFGGFFRVGG